MQKIVFFDRDGVVNLEDAPYGYEISKFYFAPGFMELFFTLKKQNAICVMVTNQSGIHRGIFTEQDLQKLNQFIQDCISANLTLPLREAKVNPKNIGFDGIYFCPHTPNENCECRKPKAKMFFDAIKDLHLDMQNSETFMLGDRDIDMQAALKAGVKNRILISKEKSENATMCAKDLKDSLRFFL